MRPTHTQATRAAGRRAQRYPRDLTDTQWQVIAPGLPEYVPGRRNRPPLCPARRIVEAILYLDQTGCAWRYLPVDSPPFPWNAPPSQSAESMFGGNPRRWRLRPSYGHVSLGFHRTHRRTVYGYLATWRSAPTAAVIVSQSVCAADSAARASRGWDDAKKVNGRKRHIAVDALGLLLEVVITAARVQDCDAARPLLWNLRRAFPSLTFTCADGVYVGKLVTWAASSLKLTVQIVRRPGDLHTFQVLPHRWVVERTFASTNKQCRSTPRQPRTMITWAMIFLMTQRPARPAQFQTLNCGNPVIFYRSIRDTGRQ